MKLLVSICFSPDYCSYFYKRNMKKSFFGNKSDILLSIKKTEMCFQRDGWLQTDNSHYFISSFRKIHMAMADSYA